MTRKQKIDMLRQSLVYCLNMNFRGRFKDLDEIIVPLRALLTAFSKDGLGNFSLRRSNSGTSTYYELFYGIDWDGFHYQLTSMVCFFETDSAQERKRKFKSFIKEILTYLEGGATNNG